jgi:hypothetical protein
MEKGGKMSERLRKIEKKKREKKREEKKWS